jgi:hypothetical protein
MWPFKQHDWTPKIERAVRHFLTLDSSDEIHAELVQSGLRIEDATKILLFTPSAFAREMFEPEGVTFSNDYFRSDDLGLTRRRKSYLREPIYQQARIVARRLIEEERFGDLRVVIAWSAEGELMQQAGERATRICKILEITHNF